MHVAGTAPKCSIGGLAATPVCASDARALSCSAPCRSAPCSPSLPQASSSGRPCLSRFAKVRQTAPMPAEGRRCPSLASLLACAASAQQGQALKRCTISLWVHSAKDMPETADKIAPLPLAPPLLAAQSGWVAKPGGARLLASRRRRALAVCATFAASGAAHEMCYLYLTGGLSGACQVSGLVFHQLLPVRLEHAAVGHCCRVGQSASWLAATSHPSSAQTPCALHNPTVHRDNSPTSPTSTPPNT